ncbi:hypothetical protein HDU82_001390 [Entophlyctis luteolus]|nr:hypothetical protein HDU82_001390 [Entophlyctis luteolus]
MTLSNDADSPFDLTADDRCFWSFEYFPPKTETGVINLFDRMERMYALGPEFVDVTWGAGGAQSELTLQICTTAQSVAGLETCMHLTCTNMPRDKIDWALKNAKEAGIQNILALRGDPPHGHSDWKAIDTGFAHAIDLVRYIREQYGNFFCIGVAGYPEGHVENPDAEADFAHFVEKAKIADYCVTQLFYDCEIYINWLAKVRAAGVTIPILPGIMPIQMYGGFKRMTALSKTHVPPEINAALDPIKDNDTAVKQFGVQLAIDMCRKLQAAGVKGFHFYCMNLEKSVRLILEGLQFVAPIEVAKPLPWNPSLAKNREKESVRPIFWRNRTRSYVLRTESWDDFPNGRWGDSRSPAYGDIGGYAVSLKFTPEEAVKIWGTPESENDIRKLFSAFCSGNLPALPWCDQLAPESEPIKKHLTDANMKGFLTINSQPAVNGVESTHQRFGWGPRNGFVYQKAYVEFFVAPDALDKLIVKLSRNPFVTYYAVNKQGDLKTNVQSEGPNAVTWGVFPGQEIVQPTVVDGTSFMAWKDEAYELWNQWARVYPPNSKSTQVIQHISDTWFLINVVNNNYRLDEAAIFEIFN